MKLRTLGLAASAIGVLLLCATACGGGGAKPPATATPEPVGFLPGPTPDIERELPFASGIPTVTQIADVFFEHPDDGHLLWDGPDDGVKSLAEGHCGNEALAAGYGVPGSFYVGESIRTRNFFLRWAVERQEAWRWTGYSHGDWQIWQGDDPATAYLVRTGEERIAFTYNIVWLCI